MWKICTRCKKHKALWAFNKRSTKHTFSVTSGCKICNNKDKKKTYSAEEKHQIYLKNRDKILAKQKIYRENNKELLAERAKTYYQKNLEENRLKRRLNYQKNKEARLAYQRKYRKDNKELVKKRKEIYRKKYKKKILQKAEEYRNSTPKYEVYAAQLTMEESPRLAKDGVSLEVKCKHCRKYFTPIVSHVRHRITALNNINNKRICENNLYCSEECKIACPIYGKHTIIASTSLREKIPQELRNEVLSRNGGMCEMCGENPSEEVHHEKPVATHPHLQLDKDNLWGLCNGCHYNVVHQLEGCTLPELKKKKAKTCAMAKKNI